MFENKCILIVDDDERNIFAMSALLKSRKAKYLVANNGEDAIKSILENPEIDMCLMDMMMPKMDGYKAIRLIRDKHNLKDFPIIAITAQAMIGDREKCMEAGASSYISKPVNVDELMKEITRLFDHG
jgi:CheY-like chemotaxis protein